MGRVGSDSVSTGTGDPANVNVLVCVHKSADLARIHKLCASILGRRYAESAALSGGDAQSGRDQLLQLLKVIYDDLYVCMYVCMYVCGYMNVSIVCFERRRLCLSLCILGGHVHGHQP